MKDTFDKILIIIFMGAILYSVIQLRKDIENLKVKNLYLMDRVKYLKVRVDGK